MMRPSWQGRTLLLTGVLGPPVASLILLMSHYLPSCTGRTEPVDLPCFVVTYVFFAVPVGYVFGLVPALLSGAMYCGALTALTKLRTQMLLRVCTGAISGGLAGGVWFYAVIGPDSHGYGAVAAVVAALLSGPASGRLEQRSSRTSLPSERCRNPAHSGVGGCQ